MKKNFFFFFIILKVFPSMPKFAGGKHTYEYEGREGREKRNKTDVTWLVQL